MAGPARRSREEMHEMSTPSQEYPPPKQTQDYPGRTSEMDPRPRDEMRSAIINTASMNGLRGNKSLIDYSATKGAILALTYSLAQAFVDRGIRVNSVAPGPVWTPLAHRRTWPASAGTWSSWRPSRAWTACRPAARGSCFSR
jgi:NAD(P)-dependent dehydrogenase (short-subunit alcohol dehydrogenase family)